MLLLGGRLFAGDSGEEIRFFGDPVALGIAKALSAGPCSYGAEARVVGEE